VVIGLLLSGWKSKRLLATHGCWLTIQANSRRFQNFVKIISPWTLMTNRCASECWQLISYSYTLRQLARIPPGDEGEPSTMQSRSYQLDSARSIFNLKKKRFSPLIQRRLYTSDISSFFFRTIIKACPTSDSSADNTGVRAVIVCDGQHTMCLYRFRTITSRSVKHQGIGHGAICTTALLLPVIFSPRFKDASFFCPPHMCTLNGLQWTATENNN